MLRKLVLSLVVGLTVLAGGAASAGSDQDMPQRMRVGTRLVAPFVMQEGDRLTGFSVDLWKEVAERAGFETEFDLHGPLPELLDAVRSGHDALAVSAISITAEREADFDFSQPMFDEGGLSILVPDAEDSAMPNFFDLAYNQKLLHVVAMLALLVVVVAHLVWFVERDGKSGIGIDRRYIPGVLEAAFWSATVLGGQGQGVPGKWVSRIVNMAAIYIGLILVAQFTASITTSVIVKTIHGDISGPNDLPGKEVATVRGSTASDYLRMVGAVPVEFDDIGRALTAVRNRKAAAVVYDTPVMLYYLSQDSTKFFRMAGAPFRREGYGILLPTNSPYRKRIDQALLELRESCAYQRLYQKWFGQAMPCVPTAAPLRYAKSD